MAKEIARCKVGDANPVTKRPKMCNGAWKRSSFLAYTAVLAAESFGKAALLPHAVHLADAALPSSAHAFPGHPGSCPLQPEKHVKTLKEHSPGLQTMTGGGA